MNKTEKKILVNMQFGSFVYGTDTPNSDRDYKGIFMSSIEDIIFGRKNDSIVTCSKIKKGLGIRNTKDDIDQELKELRKFISDAIDGQTYTIDMLYTPKKWWTKTSPEWEFIIANREKFLSKKIDSFIGYCNEQASKYGLKGSRLGTVMNTVEILKTYPESSRLGDNPRLPENDFRKYIFYEHNRNNESVNEEMLEILGKKFSFNTHIKLIIPALEKFCNEYGERAIMAMYDNGIDKKAISHAYRCCYQLAELATKNRIDFPLEQAPYLIKIKTGKVSWPKKIQDELPKLMEKSIKLIKESTLPEEPDIKFWNNFIYNTYLKYIKNDKI
jgi:predicted nucleotidyltransferase